jgi:hypothetical protein
MRLIWHNRSIFIDKFYKNIILLDKEEPQTCRYDN